MSRSLTCRTLLAALCAITVLAVGRTALAAECATDADCPPGLVCADIGGADCAAPAPCGPGATCDPAPPCEPTVIRGCVPGPCTSATDCGPGLACVTLVYEECSASGGPVCPPNTECPAPEPTEPDCTQRSVSLCAPPYVGACSADADCGPSFTCAAAEVCECSGGSAPAPDGDPTPADPPECTCAPSGEQYCRPVELACETAAECPPDWTCEHNTVGVPCAYDPATGQTICDDPPAPAPGRCVPPYWDWAVDLAEAGATQTSREANDDPNAPGRGGCRMAAGAAGSGLLLPLLVAALLGRLRRRR